MSRVFRTAEMILEHTNAHIHIYTETPLNRHPFNPLHNPTKWTHRRGTIPLRKFFNSTFRHIAQGRRVNHVETKAFPFSICEACSETDWLSCIWVCSNGIVCRRRRRLLVKTCCSHIHQMENFYSFIPRLTDSIFPSFSFFLYPKIFQLNEYSFTYVIETGPRKL